MDLNATQPIWCVHKHLFLVCLALFLPTDSVSTPEDQYKELSGPSTAAVIA